MNAQDIMTESPVTATEETSVAKVIETLQELEIRHLPILSGSSLVGIISDRDLRSVATPRLVDDRALNDIRVRYSAPISTLMNHDVVSVNPEATIEEIIDVMLEYKVGAVPVVEPSNGDLRGIVSYVDVLRALREADSDR